MSTVGSAPVTANWSKLRAAWLPPIALGFLALVVRSIHLDYPAHFDELYHVLAARSWLVDGHFRIAEGIYDRGSAFTVLMAWFFAVFGENLVVARLPSVIAGSLLVVLIFIWTRAIAGSVAAIIAALLLAIAPESIAISQFARFYALHMLLFWLGAIGIYTLFTDRRPWPQVPLIAAGVAVCLAVAGHLQPITLIGLMGIVLWVVLVVGLLWLGTQGDRPRFWWAAIAGVTATAGLLLLVTIASGLGTELFAQYRNTALWHEAAKDIFWYYHRNLRTDYPTLWPLVPVAVMIALVARPRPAGFCLCVFATAFLLHSFAGPKSPRYLQYVMPFFFVLWGIAIAAQLGALRRFMVETAERAVSPLPRFRRPAQTALLGASVLFVLCANAATVKTTARLAGIDLPSIEPEPDWQAARPVLEPWLDGEAVVLTTGELQALYYFGLYDITISRSRLGEFDGAQFDRDPRSGRPVISSAEALGRIMDCAPRGIIVLTKTHWRNSAHLQDSVATLIEERAEKIDMPRAAQGIMAYTWGRDGQGSPSEACVGLLP